MHLTYLPESESPSPDRTVLEVKITPEMIKAGVEAFIGTDLESLEPEAIVTFIFSAMSLSSPEHCRKD